MANFETELKEELYLDDSKYRIPALVGRSNPAYDSVIIFGGGGIDKSYYFDFSDILLNKFKYNVIVPQVLGKDAIYKNGLHGYQDVVDCTREVIMNEIDRTGHDVRVYTVGDSIGCSNVVRNEDCIDASAMHGMTDFQKGIDSLPRAYRYLSDVMFWIARNVHDYDMDTGRFVSLLADSDTKKFFEDKSNKKYTTAIPARALSDIKDFSPIYGLSDITTPILIIDSVDDRISALVRDDVYEIAKNNRNVEHWLAPGGHTMLKDCKKDAAEKVNDFFNKSGKKGRK